MKKAIKIILLALLFGACALLIWRCCVYADKSKFSSPEATDNIKTAYSENGTMTVYSIKIHRENSENGYFTAYAFYWFEEAGEAQITVRWNDSAYGYTDTEEGYEFSFAIRNETTGEKYQATVKGFEKSLFYNFRKLVFDGITIKENDELKLVMYIGDVEIDSCPVKHAEQEMSPYNPGNVFFKDLTH